MHYTYQSNLLQNSVSTFFTNPKKFFGILAGSTVVVGGIIYQYGIKILYNIGTIFGIAYGNNQVAKLAIEQSNAGLYDFAATFAKILNWISPTWFPKIDPNPALIKGIENANLEMIDTALEHDADVNQEGKMGRPLEYALNLKTEQGYFIAKQLISHNADLSKSSYKDTLNLFWLIIHTNKKELFDAAIKQATTNEKLITSTNDEGNSILHLIPVSPDLQDTIIDMNFVEKLSQETLSNKNHNGKDPVSIVMYTHTHHRENINVKLAEQYLRKADITISQKHFKDIISSPDLYKITKQLVNHKDFNANKQDSSKKLPIDYLLTSDNGFHNSENHLDDFINHNLNQHLIKDSEFRDELAVNIIDKMDKWLLKNSHLFRAYLDNMPKTIKKLHEKHFSKETSAMQSFFLKPQGVSSKGQTLLHLMADGTIPFYKEKFEEIAYFLFQKTTLNPFNRQDDYQMNVAATACANKNFNILACIINIEHKLKQQLTKSIKKNKVFFFVSSFQNELFFMHAQQKKILKYLPKKAIEWIPLQIKNHLITQTNKCLQLNTENSNDNPNLVLFSPLEEEKELDLQARMDKIGHNNLELKQYSSLRRKTIHSYSQKEIEEEESLGIPDEVKLIPIDHSKIPQIHQNEALIISGMLTKQFIMYKGLVATIIGMNFEESFITTLSYVVTFIGAGYVEACGRGYENAKILALTSGGIYSVAEYMKGTAYNEYTPPEERGIHDFTYKYGSYILMSVPISLLYQAAFATTGGYVYGQTGMLKSSSIILSISLMHSYQIYTTDIDKVLQYEEFNYSNYFTAENIMALGAICYMEYYYSTLKISMNTVKLSTSALTIGKLTLDVLSTISNFFIMKSTSGTVLSITEPIMKSAQTVFEPLIKDTYKTILSNTNSSIVLLKDYIPSFYINDFKNTCYDIISTLNKVTTNNDKDNLYYNADEFCMEEDVNIVPAGENNDLMCPANI